MPCWRSARTAGEYWDSSALLPLIVLERTSAAIQGLLTTDLHVLTWWASRIEAASALSGSAARAR